jgi:selenocysteine lyase/cysteine desulfurase
MDALPNQGHYFNQAVPRKKMLPAGPDHAQIAAASGVARYLDAVYEHHFSRPVDQAEKGRQLKNLFQDHERKLLVKLLDWLRQREDLRIVGPHDPGVRVPTVAIVPKKRSIDEVYAVLTEKRVMAGRGHFYSVRPLMGLNIPIETGVLRFSFLHYTIEDEIDQLVEGLSAALN